MYRRRLRALLIALAALSPLPARAASAPADSARLIGRARELYPRRASNEAEYAELRPQVLALADSLEALGLVGAAGRGYESAGINAFRLGRREEALATWRAGLAKVAPHTGRDATKIRTALLNAVGVGHAAGGELELAIETWLELIPLRESVQDTYGLGVSWGNIANSYNQLGRVDELLDASTRAERWDRLSGNVRGEAASLLRRTELMTELGRLPEALSWADSVLALARRDSLVEALGIAAGKRAVILETLGRGEEALADLEAGIVELRAAGERYYALFAENTRLYLLLRLGRDEDCLRAARALRAGTEELGNAPLTTSCRGFAGRALLALGRLEEAEAELLAARDAFEADRERLNDEASQAGRQGVGSPLYAALAKTQLRLERPREAWASAERGRAPLFRQRLGGRLEPEALEAIQARLGAERAALLQYVEDEADGLLLFLITGTDFLARELPRRPELLQDARAALALIAAGAEDARCLPPLERIAEQVLWPVLPLLPDDLERLYLVPPDLLQGFPFEVLPLAPGRGETLGERRAVAALPGASALVLLARRPSATKGMLALADPSYGNPANDARHLGASRGVLGVPLPEARNEVKHIVVRGGRLLLGAAARKSAVLAPENLGLAVLHFATHALINPLNGEDAGLLLGGESRDEPQFLRAGEVERLALRADLVTLSACRSSIGQLLFGEGSYGLPRAFLIAGSRSVVSSLWDVEDAAARRFMERFYAALREGEARDQALRRARSELAAAGYPLRDRAAFVLMGLGEAPVAALDGARSASRLPSPLLAGLVLIPLALAVGLLWRRRHDAAFSWGRSGGAVK